MEACSAIEYYKKLLAKEGDLKPTANDKKILKSEHHLRNVRGWGKVLLLG